MPISFYPHEEDVAVGSIKDRLEILMEGAERYKAFVLDAGSAVVFSTEPGKRNVPKEIKVAFNWQEISRIMSEIRAMPEGNLASRGTKGDCMLRLAEIYEVLRGAKMPKLENLRAALMLEAQQLRASGK